MLKSLSKLEDVLPRVFQTSILRDVLDRDADAGVQRAGGEVGLTREVSFESVCSHHSDRRRPHISDELCAHRIVEQRDGFTYLLRE